MLPKIIDTTLSTVVVSLLANTVLILAYQAHAGAGPKGVANLTILSVFVTSSWAPVQLSARGIFLNYFRIDCRLLRGDILIE